MGAEDVMDVDPPFDGDPLFYEPDEDQPKPRKKMKTEKDEGDWIIQGSWKRGDFMLNLRAKTYEAWKDDYAKLEEDIELFRDAANLFGSQLNLPIGDVRATPPPDAPAAGNGGPGKEVGPIAVSGVKDDKVTAGPNAKFPGRVYPKWVVEFGNGALVAETLTPLIAEAAKNLLGKNAYARVEQTKYGYKLINVRTAV